MAAVEIEANLPWQHTLERLRGYIARRVGDRDVADDITQEVIVRSIAAGALERVDNPIAWLYRSASNAVIDYHRTRRRHEPLDTTTPLAVELDDADESDAAQQLSRCVAPLVEQLEPIYRDALVRVELDGLTQAAAAREAGVSVSGMKSRVQRGRSQLKSLLTACCDVELDRRGTPTDVRPRTSACSCPPPFS